jgi:argininosuccinate lyase
LIAAGKAAKTAEEASKPASKVGINNFFKEAHEITGALVQACEKHEIELWEASSAMLAEVDARLLPEVRDCLSLEAAIAARSGWGGTAPERVREQIGRLKIALAAQQQWAESYQGFRI